MIAIDILGGKPIALTIMSHENSNHHQSINVCVGLGIKFNMSMRKGHNQRKEKFNMPSESQYSSSSSSSAHFSPLLDIGHSNCSPSLDFWLLASSSHQPPCVNCHCTWPPWLLALLLALH
jgi:hypothetical protein